MSWLIAAHHLGSDGLSFQFLLRELAEDFSLSNNERRGFLSLHCSIQNFAYWQREQMQGESWTTWFSYWEKRFNRFPLTPSGAAVRASCAWCAQLGGASEIISIPAELYDALKSLRANSR